MWVQSWLVDSYTVAVGRKLVGGQLAVVRKLVGGQLDLSP